MNYNLTQQQFEQLHTDLNNGRATNPVVKVNREALRNLLEDFAALQRERNDNLPVMSSKRVAAALDYAHEQRIQDDKAEDVA